MPATQGQYVYDYPRPMVVVDIVLFGPRAGGKLDVLLIQRGQDPYKGHWATPGGFVDMDEPLDAAAYRELEEETGITGIRLEQFYTFGRPDRDPRGRNIAVGYLALVNPEFHTPRAGDDAAETRWWSVDELPSLAFDHDDVVETALARLRVALRCFGIGRQCFEGPFTLDALREVYESVLAGPLNPERFAHAIQSIELIEPTEKDGYFRFREPWPGSLEL